MIRSATRRTRSRMGFAVVAGLGAAFALGTAGAQASLIMPQLWEFGTNPGLDNLDDFQEHVRGTGNYGVGVRLESVGVDVGRRAAISTELSNLGAGQRNNFTVRALVDWIDDEESWSGIGIGMLGTYTGIRAINESGDSDYLIIGLRNTGEVMFWQGAVLSGTTQVGDLSDLMDSSWLSNDDRLIELIVNAVYHEDSGAINFDWTVTLIDEADPTNTVSRSSGDAGQEGFTAAIADYDGQRFGYGVRTANGHLSNLREFEVIPEPASVALLGLGGLVLLRRRSGRAVA